MDTNIMVKDAKIPAIVAIIAIIAVAKISVML